MSGIPAEPAFSEPIFYKRVAAHGVGFILYTQFRSEKWRDYETALSTIKKLEAFGVPTREQAAELEGARNLYDVLHVEIEQARQTRLEHMDSLHAPNIPAHRAVLVMDFGSCDLGPYGKSHANVLNICVATSKELIFPEKLDGAKYLPEKEGIEIPFSEEVVVKPEANPHKRKRRTKEEIARDEANGVPRPPRKLSNLAEENQASKELPQLPDVQGQAQREFKSPFIHYFDFIAVNGQTIDGQTTSFVEVSIQKLVDGGLFSANGITELLIWSDGCGKHFKAYDHLRYVSVLIGQDGLQVVTRRFLWPGFSFNWCDAHFAKMKLQLLKSQQNAHWPDTLEDVARLLFRLSRTMIFVLEEEEYEDVHQPRQLEPDLPFMRENLEFVIVSQGVFRARRTTDALYVEHTLRESSMERDIRPSEERAAQWFEASATRARNLKVASEKRASVASRKALEHADAMDFNEPLDDELDDSSFDDSEEDTRPKKDRRLY